MALPESQQESPEDAQARRVKTLFRLRAEYDEDAALDLYSEAHPDKKTVLDDLRLRHTPDSVFDLLIEAIQPPAIQLTPDEQGKLIERQKPPEERPVRVKLPEVRLSEQPQVLAEQVPVEDQAGGTLVTQAFGQAVAPLEELGRRQVRGMEIQAEGRKQVIEALATSVANPKNTASAMKLFAQGMPSIPKQIAAQAIAAAQGHRGASVVDKGWGDRAYQAILDDSEAFQKAAVKRYGDKKLFPGVPIAAVAELPQNLGFSGVSLLGGFLVGTPIAFLPVPGARPIAIASGSVASGALAFNMASYQIMQEYLEVKNAESLQKRGRGITQAEEDQLKKQFNSAAIKHGLWEAIPEMIANGVVASNIIRPLSKVASRTVAGQIAQRVASIYASELATETVTEMGQQRVRAAEGLPGAREVDFTNPSDWLSALKDIAPQTFLLTTVTAGVGTGAVATARRISSLKAEVGETHPQFEQFTDAIKKIESTPVMPNIIEEGKRPAIVPEIEAPPVEAPPEIVREADIAVVPQKTPRMPVTLERDYTAAVDKIPERLKSKINIATIQEGALTGTYEGTGGRFVPENRRVFLEQGWRDNDPDALLHEIVHSLVYDMGPVDLPFVEEYIKVRYPEVNHEKLIVAARRQASFGGNPAGFDYFSAEDITNGLTNYLDLRGMVNQRFKPIFDRYFGPESAAPVEPAPPPPEEAPSVEPVAEPTALRPFVDRFPIGTVIEFDQVGFSSVFGEQARRTGTVTGHRKDPTTGDVVAEIDGGIRALDFAGVNENIRTIETPDTIPPEETPPTEVPIVALPEIVRETDIAEGRDFDALTRLGYDANEIKRMLPEEAQRVVDAAISSEWAVVTPEGVVLDARPPGDIDTEIIKDEPQFIDEGPPIGQSIRQVIPPEIEVIKPEKDLTGFFGLFKRWMSPVRTLMQSNPTVNRIARMGRDTMSGMANETNAFNSRVEAVKRGLSGEEQEQVIDFLESEREVDLTAVPTKLQPAYIELDNIRSEMLAIIQDDMGIDTSEWGMTPEQWWPHIFVGEYQIQTEQDGEWHTVDGGFSRNLREAVDKAVAVLEGQPDVNIRIKPRGFNNDYSATLLTRKGFGRFISEVSKATELDKDEIVSMMRGVAAIKPRGKFAGNLKQRTANLGGYMKDFDAMKIYTSRILRKKWLDPFRKAADAQARTLPPSLQKYFLGYIDDVSGKYDPIDNRFQMRRNLGRVTRAQSVLKLGFRPITALVNRLQPTQLAFGEIGFYLYRGYRYKRTAKGQEIIERSGIRGEAPKFAEGATGIRRGLTIKRPVRAAQDISLAMFSIAEQANRADTVVGGYLYARKIFTMPRDKAERRGLGYVYKYLDDYDGDPEAAAIEFGKDLNTWVNFIMSNADLPLIMRGPVRKTAFQFKSFPINFVATTMKWLAQPPTNAHYWARLSRLVVANAVVGGVRATPFIGRKLWWLIMGSALLSGDAPRDRTKEILGRGVLSLFGVDLSQRVGPGEFLPREMKDLLGPLAGDIRNFYRFVDGDWDWNQLVRSAPALRDIVQAIAETDDIVDQNKRMRKIAERTGWDRILQAAGIPLEKVTVTRDAQIMFSKISKEYSKKKAQAVDGIIRIMTDDSIATESQFKKAMTPIIKKMNDEFILVTSDDIINELSAKAQPALIRTFKQTPLARKPEVLDMLFKIDKAHTNIITEETR